MAKYNPSSLQVIDVLTQMRKLLGPVSSQVRRSYDTVTTSMNQLNRALTKSKLFQPATMKMMTSFFKKSPKQIRQMDRNMRSFSTGTAKIIKTAEELKTALPETQTTQATEQTMTVPSEFLQQMQTLSLSLTGLKSEIEGLEAGDIKLSGEAVTELRDVKEEVGGLQETLRGVADDIRIAGRDARITANRFNHFTEEISDSTNEMDLLGRETKMTSMEFASVFSRVSNINNRLFHTRKRMDAINKEMKENINNHEDLSDSLEKTSSIMLAIAGMDALSGIRTEVAQEQISSLGDELIDFQKRAGIADNAMENWRTTAINTADALWKVRKVATTPAEVVDAYTKLREAGITSEKQIKQLANVIIAADKAIGVTKEEVTEFASAMIEGTNVSAKGVGNILSAFTRLRKFSKLSAKDMMEGAKEIDKEFSYVLTKLSDQGKQTFTTTLVSAMSAFREAGVENTDLIKRMAVALKNPQEAAQTFSKILVGTGYDVMQMQRDLLRGDPTKAINAILSGLQNTRHMSGIEMEAFLQDTGLALEDIDRLVMNSGKVRAAFQKGVTETIKELRNNQQTLFTDAAKENQKLGKTFEILGNRIKTWLAKTGISALNSFNLSLGDVLDRAPEILILATAVSKLKNTWGVLGNLVSKIGLGKIFSNLGVSSVGASTGISSIGASILPVLGPVLLLAGAVTALWAAFKYGPKIMDWLKETFPNWGKGVDLLWSKLNNFINWFEEKFPNVFEITRDVLVSIGNAIRDLVLHPIETVKKAFNNVKKFFGVGKQAVDYGELGKTQAAQQRAKNIAVARARLRTRAEQNETKMARQRLLDLRQSKETTWDQLAKAEEAFRVAREKEKKAFESALAAIQSEKPLETAIPEVPTAASPLTQSPAIVENIVSKIIEPEPPKKIFAERKEIISPAAEVEVDVHQEDVVSALQKLGDRIEKAVRDNRQNIARSNKMFRSTPDEHVELSRQWRR